MQYTLKQQPSDFIVSEDMDITHTGDGEHLWLFIEKQNLTTDVALSLLSKAFGVQLRDVNASGKKDRHAVTRQWVSLQIPGKAPHMVAEAGKTLEAFLSETPLYEGEKLKVLKAAVHVKKCQTGCHRGNFFEINVVVDGMDDTQRLDLVKQLMLATGFPNAFGDQRFGRDNVGLAEVDEALCKIHPKTKPGRLKSKDAWTCSQARSVLFNEVLKLRQAQKNWTQVQYGDVMNLKGSQSCFCVTEADDLQVLQRRVDEGDIIPTGPLFGRSQAQLQASGDVFALETEVWSRLSDRAQNTLIKLQSAGRRPLWTVPESFEIQVTQAGVKCCFWLPKGAYATECIDAIVNLYNAPDTRPL